jgi:predicted DNA-binding transcriptional regulator YafY
VADTSRRALRLLSLLATGRRWSLAELGRRLEVSPRTVRRDVATLRDLGYPVTAVSGPAGGYLLGERGTLPPLLLDEDQALATAVALQTAPTTVFGLGEDAARALDTLSQVLPARTRGTIESLRLTRLHNYWDFAAPPIPTSNLTAVGAAVSRQHVLGYDRLRPDGSRPGPHDADFQPPHRLEPHHLVVWAGRWYVVGHDPDEHAWRVLRIDRIHLLAPSGRSFDRREVPGGDVAELVMTSHDRGDVPAQWPCTGSVTMELPAEVVARWAPGGSVVERLDERRTRLTVGAWSWAGVAGILATFDTDVTDVEPAELTGAFRRLARRHRG